MSGRALDSTVATEDEVRDVLLELQALLSSEANRSMKNKLLEKICCHIKRLQREVDDLSKRISEQLLPPDSAEACILNMLMEL